MKIAAPARRRLPAGLSTVAAVCALAAAGGQANAANSDPDVTGISAASGIPVRHVVVIYLENHSFDNVLGYWCDEHPGRCPDGGMPARVRLSNGTVVTPGVDSDTVPLVTHSVGAQLAAMHIVGGVPQMDGWQNVVSSTGGSCDAAAGYRCISGYKPGQIPNLTTLASDFAISDNTFSMGDSPSWGGHLYAVLASMDGFLGNIPGPGTPSRGLGCNSHMVTQWVSPAGATKLIPSCIPDYALNVARYPHGGAFEATPAKWEPSILDRLDAAGLSWKIYDGGHQPATDGWAICPSLADCWYTSQAQRMSSMSQFRADAASGTLPDFSIIIPGNIDEEYSQHNGNSMTAGDNWIGQLVSAIMHSPGWSSTTVFITYDDCGCFYDQAVPRRNPDGTWQGPRTPLVIISPYARPGYTDTTHTTFAGILAYVEHIFGLPPLGPNDRNAYDFSNAFNYSQPPLPQVKLVQRPLPASARHLHQTPALLNDPT